MTKTARSLLKTLAYADIFDFPLREDELWRYFIGTKTRLSKFRETLHALVNQGHIEMNFGYYCLKGRRQLIPKRIKRKKITATKLRIARDASLLLKHIPTIWFIGVSGAVAMGNAPLDDDIDIFIITAPGSLWTTRLIVTSLLDIKNLRRKPGDKIYKNKICLNMFMDASVLVLPRTERDLYGAHEVVQLRPLVNKNKTFSAFIYENRWVSSFLPHAVSFSKTRVFTRMANNPLEVISKKIQLIYMSKRRTNEKLNDTLLRFHPRDARLRVIPAYYQKLKSLGLN